MASLFIRKSRRGDWDKVDPGAAADLSFPADVLSDILDEENEVSVWEVDEALDPGEVDVIAAALHNRGVGNLSDVTLRVISEFKVKDKDRGLGLAMKTTKGESLDRVLNKAGKHHVIVIKSVGDAIELAKAFKARPPVNRNQGEVMQAMATGLASGRISPDDVSGSLMKKLFEQGYLQLKLPADKPDQA
ncbi:hypothetical protein [Bradyrhizobium sp. DASA03120]|uniref:hypothetical protein n=1 Tax=Bradyrhizobium sp. SMVTL-02 TaxID=3395917 RepID=UPI003F6ECE5F